MTAKRPPGDAQKVRESAQLPIESAGAAGMLPPSHHAILLKDRAMNKSPAPSAPVDALDRARKILSLESAWEIEVLAILILEKIGSPEWDLEIEPLMLLRTIGLRVKALSQVVMDALDDEIQTTAFLTEKVFGDAERGPASV